MVGNLLTRALLSMSRLQHLRSRAGLAALALLLVTCFDAPTEPAISGRVGIVSLRIVYPPKPSLASAGTGSGGFLAVNNVRVTLTRGQPLGAAASGASGAVIAGPVTVLDTVIPFRSDASTLPLTLEIPLVSQHDTLQGSLQLRSDSALVFVGNLFLIVTPGTNSTPIPVTVFNATGVFSIASIEIFPPNAFVPVLDSLVYTVKAFDALGLPVTGFYASWTVKGPSGATMTAVGTLRAPSAAGSGTVQVFVNQADTNITVTTPVSFGLPPILISGDSVGAGYIYAVSPDGLSSTPIDTLGTGSGESWPRWSPDRRRVAFGYTLGYPAPYSLYIKTDSGEVQVVSDTSIRKPRWNRTSRNIAFGCGDYFFSSTVSGVCVLPNADVPSTALPNLRASMVFLASLVPSRLEGSTEFGWDPVNTDRVLFTRDTIYDQDSTSTFQFLYSSTFYSVNADGSGLSPVTPAVLTVGTDTLQVRQFDWTPDGAFVVFSAVRTNRVTDIPRLYQMRRDGSSIVRITAPSNTAGNPSQGDSDPIVSPNGRRVLFVRSDGCFDGCVQNLYVINRDGTGLGKVTANTFLGSRVSGDWSPDGTNLVTESQGPSFGQVVRRVSSSAPFAVLNTIPASHDGTVTSDQQPSWRP